MVVTSQKIKSLDIVTSTLNEESNVLELYARLNKVMAQEKDYSWRLIICDNCSSDDTWNRIIELAREDSRVLGIQLTRDFRLDNSLTCGLDHCSADLAIFMASDLEDPPELIPSFLRSYEDGNLHVAALITSREEIPFFRKFMTKVFYQILHRLSNGLIGQNVSDFRLVDKKVYLAARLLREKYRFMRGIFAWTGYPIYTIPTVRQRRKHGKSSFDSHRLIHVVDQALEWIYAFSRIPLKIVSIFGILFGITGLLSLFFVVTLTLTRGVPFAGFGSLMSILLIGFAFNFTFLGIIGTYLGLVSDEIKSRPIYIIRDKTVENV